MIENKFKILQKVRMVNSGDHTGFILNVVGMFWNPSRNLLVYQLKTESGVDFVCSDDRLEPHEPRLE